MGLTIHYQGRIADKQKLPQLIEELEEISKAHGWNYHILGRKFPTGVYLEDEHDGNLYGILFNPPGSEPVSFTFLRNGRMCGPVQLNCWGESTNEKELGYLYLNSTKTQYAGSNIHKMVIGIFRYIVPHFLADFKMIDEAAYWETNDEKLLEENFRRNTELINGFADALSESQAHEGEEPETFIQRVIREFWEKKKKNKKDDPSIP